MATQAISLNVPAGNGVGTASSAIALDSVKSIVVGGDFLGVVTVEAANGSDFFPVVSFTEPGFKPIEVVASQMRVRVEGLAAGSVDAVAVIAEQNTVSIDTLAVPASVPGGEAIGASTDVSAYGSAVTVNIAGAFEGSIIVEVSGDNTNFSPILAFNKPTYKTVRAPAQFMRLRRFSTVSDTGTPVCEVGFASVVSGDVAPAEMDFVHASITGTPTSTVDGAPIPFNQQLANSNLTWDTVNNETTLLANSGKYLLISAARIVNPNGFRARYQWRDDTAGANVGSRGTNNTMNAGFDQSSQQMAVAIVEPAVDTTYFVEIISGASGATMSYTGNQCFALVLKLS